MSDCQKSLLRPLSSAEAIAGNEDTMTEILIRLPAKSLCRFKCISKRWNSLISHPDFSLLRKPHSISGILAPQYPLPKEPSHKYVHLAGKRPTSSPLKCLNSANVKIIDSCNGLLLLISWDYDSGELNYYVLNPTTKQFFIIPHPSYLPNRGVCTETLVFDPFRAPHYQIVFLLRSRYSYPLTYQIQIYSSETGAWRLGDPFTTTLDFYKAVFFNNTIHWLNDSFETWLLLDFDQLCLKTIPMPTIPDRRDEITIKCFGDSQGHLNLICADNYTLDVLQMESDYSKWCVKYSIHLHDIAATFPRRPNFSELSIPHLVIGEVEEESTLVFYMHGMVVSYNFKDKKVKKLCNLARYNRWSDAYQYIETLVRI